MSYRHYPNRERALSQLDRHAHPTPALSASQMKMAQDARAALEAAGRTMRPLHEAMLQFAGSAPAVLASTAPAVHKFVEAMRQSARTA